MNKLIYIILFLSLFTSCEEVIEIDVPSEEPRLIVDALIRINVNDPFYTLRVKVGLTSPFFGEVPVTGLEQISICALGKPSTFADPGCGILLETEPGVYEKQMGKSFIGEYELLLQIDYEDEEYLAYANYIPVNFINVIEQVERSDGKTEVSISFFDEPYQQDFYLFDFGFGEFVAMDDLLMRGEAYTFSYVYDRDIEPGTELEVSIMGIDRSFYNYMNVLLEQNEEDFGLFSTPVATVRGNIINVTDIDNFENFDNVAMSDNFALGYFAVAQTYTRRLIVE